MGGGDLNSKKSWHPNTMKNQERVWKAEQAVAQEKKRIQELQREQAQERDRFELNNMIKQNSDSASGSNDNRLHWMYDPDKKVQQEDYLLGKSIEKNYDNVEKPEDTIPAVARRVVGSSMLSSAEDSQVDLARKLREDPLLLVKERERAARAALLNNPLQRRRLTELLKKEQEQKHKSKKKAKKKDKDLDKQLAAKLNALGGEKGLNLATLLASDDSDSDSSSSSEEEKPKKKKKNKHDKTKKQKKSKKKKHSSSNESIDDEKHKMGKGSRQVSQQGNYEKHKESRKRRSDNDSSENDRKYKKSKTYVSESHNREESQNKYKKVQNFDKYKRDDNDRRHKTDNYRSDQSNKDRYESDRKRSGGKGMSEEDRAAKLAAMAAAGAEREVSRGRRVAEQRAAEHAERAEHAAPRARQHREARMLPDSLESRIHSNRHYIQRNDRHMNEHFARR